MQSNFSKKNKNLLLWLKKKQRFSITTKCWICKKQCKANDVKVKDRCHITWKYWCSTHKKCYSNLNVTSKIPVLPNLQNYDSHLIFQELGDCNSKRHVISKLIEIYMTFALEQSKNDAINPGLHFSLWRSFFKWLIRKYS